MADFVNPNYTDATRTAYKDALAAYVATLDASVRTVSFDDVRANVAEMANALDGHIHQAILDNGYGVENV